MKRRHILYRYSTLSARQLLAAFMLFVATHVEADDLRLFTVGSGEISGGYFAAANALCESVNRARRGVLRCSPEATSGSLYNLAALREKQVDFAIVQSDWHRLAFEGTDVLADWGPMSDMRSVMSLYPETLTVLARSDSGIERLADIVGKRVDIGHPASGRNATARRLMSAIGHKADDFDQLLELPSETAIDELCAGRIDATILVTGHPSELVARALRDCHAQILPMRGPRIDALFAASSEYVPSRIPSSAYPELPNDIPSHAVMATLVTRTDVPDEFVSAMVREALKSLPALAHRARVLQDLRPDEMQTRGLTVPLHPAAEKSYAK